MLLKYKYTVHMHAKLNGYIGEEILQAEKYNVRAVAIIGRKSALK